mgnify:CR=1 FL=1
MLPDISAMIVVVLVGVAMSFFSAIFPKKIASAAEIIVTAAVLVYLFSAFSFGQAAMLLAFGASAYGSFSQLADPNKREKRKELLQTLQNADSAEIVQKKDAKRIGVDLLLTLLAGSGAFLFFVLAPANYVVLKMFIGFMFLSVSAQMIGRIGNFYSTRIYWLPEQQRIVIVSLFQSKDFPAQDIKEVRSESSPDLLKLHPLFTFLSSNQDYTSSFTKVLKLSFPGEHIYLTPQDCDYWEHLFSPYVSSGNNKRTKDVLPLWHPAVLKRLFWKAYYAVAVKGISAYTGLLCLLIWLDAPAWAMILFVILWWMLNVYVSDRVLIAATDAEPLTEGEICDRAQAIFAKAGITGTRLFIVDSPVYNGLAAGMNIGRAAVMLTTATLKLPTSSVEAILAHEAVHVKKRDVLLNQIIRLIFAAVIGGLVYLFFDEMKWLAQHHAVVLIVLVYVLMVIFPVYLSFFAQWTEVRADHLGAALLSGGNAHMANGLADLGLAQERDLEKSLEYSSTEKGTAPGKTSGIERDSWFWRFLEFQFQAHPPMYWRIQSLQKFTSWKKARKQWMIDRFKESCPDLFSK